MQLWRERFRPDGAWGALAWAVAMILMVTVMYAYVAQQRVAIYERQTARDPETGIMRGAEPRDLGPVDAPGAVLFVHGFIGTPNNYNDLPDRIAEQGWRVRVMLVPGHGTTPHLFEETTADDMLEGVLDEVRALRGAYEQVVVVGHSMGGALASLAAAEQTVDGLVLIAPFFGLTTPSVAGLSVERWARLARPAVEWVPRGPNAPVNLVENREKVLSYHWVPVDGALAALELGRRANSTYVFERMEMPVLLIHSEGDKVTSLDAARDAVEQFASADKEYCWLHKSNHVYFWDYDQQEVIDEVAQWLARFTPEAGESPAEPGEEAIEETFAVAAAGE